MSAGEYVNIGDALVDLVQFDPIKLDFSVPGDPARRRACRPDRLIAVSLDAWPGQRFEGRVYAVAPQVDAATRTPLRAQLPNPDGRLKPGQFCLRGAGDRRNASAW